METLHPCWEAAPSYLAIEYDQSEMNERVETRKGMKNVNSENGHIVCNVVRVALPSHSLRVS